MSPSNTLPVPAPRELPQLPALLPSTAADEFLPAPGSWANGLGQRVLNALLPSLRHI